MMHRGAIVSALMLAGLCESAWAQEVIVYTLHGGGVSVVNPAPTCLAELQRPVGTPSAPQQCPALGLTPRGALEWVRDKDVPAGATNTTILDRSLLPDRATRYQWRFTGGAVVVDSTVAGAEDPTGFRRALGAIFAGPPAQQRIRWGDVLQTHPWVAVILPLLRGEMPVEAKATVTEIITRVCQKVGAPTGEVLTETEYTNLRALAHKHALDALVPARPGC